MNRIFGFLIGSILAAILLLALPIGCKSVRKSQNEKFETATVKKSDSSSSKSYSYTDTTKTDSSTEVTTTTVTIDSVEWSDGLGIGYEVTTELPGPDLSKGYNTIGVPNEPWVIRPDISFKDSANIYIGYGTGSRITTAGPCLHSGLIKAKGVKITTTTIKQAAIEAKGVTIKNDVKQTDIKVDSVIVKTEKTKETVKKPSIRMGIGLVFGIAILIGLIWLAIWVWRKKKAAITTIAGKVF